MRHKHVFALYSAVCLLVLAGCRPDVQPPTESSPEEVYRQWLALADAPVDRIDFSAAVMLGEQLAAADRMDLVLDALGSPEANPKVKVLAVVTLTPLVRPEMESRLAELTAAANEATTRACAVKLLGFIDSDTARARLRELMGDAEHRTRVTATLMLARARDAEALDALPALWADPETGTSERIELVWSLPDEASERFAPIYKEAALDLELDPEVRIRAVTALGKIGDADAAEILDRCSVDDPVPAMREMARAALAALHARTASSEENAPETGEE
ncbi:MAG TPA: HEAT repeat domain-containing protein [Candidatus Hydrogenedentes bacterium]|nr:HEAT repeat domain-containing protein [Candidatus Hydrogenedentota bacterium]